MLLLLFSWSPVRDVCPNYELAMFQPRTGTPPDLGSIADCYVAILLIPAPPFFTRHPMPDRVRGTCSLPFPLSLSDQCKCYLNEICILVNEIIFRKQNLGHS